MVIRGKTRGNGKQLGSYLMKQAENDAVHVLDIRGTGQLDDIHYSLLEMSLTSELTKSDKGLYHAQMNPAYGDDKKMTREDWLKAADILESELGLTGQKRVIVLHDKKDRLHAHVVWERYDHDKGIMVSDSYSRYAQDRARKTIEKELNHTPTPHRNAKRPEMKVELTELWNATETGGDFIKAISKKGYTVAVGKDRPYMIVDDTGRSFDLVRQLNKVKTKEVGQYLKEQKLPTEKEAIAKVRARQSEKSFNTMQERFTDQRDSFKEKRAGEADKRQYHNDKLSDMKGEGKKIGSPTNKPTMLPKTEYQQQTPTVKFTVDETKQKRDMMKDNATDLTSDEAVRKMKDKIETDRKRRQQEKEQDKLTGLDLDLS